MTNLLPHRYREVSVAQLDQPLTEASLRRHFLGREAYRRTSYVVARHREQAALIQVETASRGPLFAPITAVTVLATPAECAVVDAPSVDCDIPNQLARVAEERAPGARCVVVYGRYRHVSFILDPHRHEIGVLEVVPPEPPKLVDLAERVLESAADLPPMRLRPVLVDLVDLARQTEAACFLLPCRGSGISLGSVPIYFLDERPPEEDWVQIGCARSREIHRWFYGRDAICLEMCPRVLSRGRLPGPVLTKCCLLEDRIEREALQVTVPWGSSLELVHQGLQRVAETIEPEWAIA